MRAFFSSGKLLIHLDLYKITLNRRFCIPGKRWDNVTRFTDKVGWAILWDFNLLGTSLGRWNCSQAEVFLKYSASRGVKIPMFELGNGRLGLELLRF